MADLDQLLMSDVPKADLHMHAETYARLDRLISKQSNKAPHDCSEELTRLAHVPPGMARLEQAFSVVSSPLDRERLDALDSNDEIFVEWLAEALGDTALDGAVLTQMRFGAKGGKRPGFMSLFRDAEERVQSFRPQEASGS